MWVVLALLVIAAVLLITLWLKHTNIEPQNNNPVYVCPECGDHHCNCYPEKEESRD